AASIEVPTKQYRGELRFRIRRAELALIHESANAADSRALDPTQAPIGRDDDLTGNGGAVRYSIDAADALPGLMFGLGLEFTSWEIPYVEYRTCVSNCTGPTSRPEVSRGVQDASTAAFSFTPTYRRGPLAIFGGAYARRHPTIVRKGTEYGPDDDRD